MLGKGLTNETISMVDQAIRSSQQGPEVIKAITQGTGLIGYDLEAPAKFLVPLISPLRNMLPRLKGPTGIAANWRAFTGLTNNNATQAIYNKIGVGEGDRNATMSETVLSYMANYKNLGMENNVTFEATYASMQFDDAHARMVKNLLKLFLQEEEHVILGGNNTLVLAQPVIGTMADVPGSGTLNGNQAAVSIICVPLTYDGLRTAAVSSAGVLRSYVRTNADSTTATVQGFMGVPSANSTAAIANDGSNDHAVSCTVAVVPGARGYAWYYGATAGAERIAAITTINSVLIKAAPTGTNQLASAVAGADTSLDALLFDGILSLVDGAGQFNPAAAASGGLVSHFGTGTAGTGVSFTSDGTSGIPEIDSVLKTLFDNYKLGPKRIWMSSSVMQFLTTLVIGNGGAPLIRFNRDVNPGQVAKGIISAGVVIGDYLNKFTQESIEFRVHPFMPKSTLLYQTEQLPGGVYPENDVENILAIRNRRDYYEIDWPLRTRKYEAGVYADEVLQCYAPFALALQDNVGGL